MGPGRPRSADGAALVAPLELRLDSQWSRPREADRQSHRRNREYRDADRAQPLSGWLDWIRLRRRDCAARVGELDLSPVTLETFGGLETEGRFGGFVLPKALERGGF